MKRIGIVFALIVCIPLCALIVQSRAEEKKEAQTEEKVYAVVNDVKITEADFNEEVNSIPANYRAMINANKKKFLDDLVLQELLTQQAKKEGLDKDEEFIASLEKIKNKLLAKRIIEKQIMEPVKVSEDDLKKYYEEHKNEFSVPEQVNAAHILILVKEDAREDEKKAAKEKSEKLLKEIKGGADFSALAKDNSDCPSKVKGGDLGFFSKGQMVPEFEEAAFKLKPGEISEVVATKYGYHIIKIIDKKPAGQQEFSDVKDEIEQILLRDKQKTVFEDYTKKLKDSAKITINEAALTETASK